MSAALGPPQLGHWLNDIWLEYMTSLQWDALSFRIKQLVAQFPSCQSNLFPQGGNAICFGVQGEPEC